MVGIIFGLEVGISNLPLLVVSTLPRNTCSFREERVWFWCVGFMLPVLGLGLGTCPGCGLNALTSNGFKTQSRFV